MKSGCWRWGHEETRANNRPNPNLNVIDDYLMSIGFFFFYPFLFFVFPLSPHVPIFMLPFCWLRARFSVFINPSQVKSSLWLTKGTARGFALPDPRTIQLDTPAFFIFIFIFFQASRTSESLRNQNISPYPTGVWSFCNKVFERTWASAWAVRH